MRYLQRVTAASMLLLALLGFSGPGFQASLEVGPKAGWQWPSRTPVPVTRAFDPPALRWLPGHRGVDLGMTPGQVVSAPCSGTVIYAGQLVDRPVISIRHNSGLRLTFEPVEPAVAVGDAVTAGQPIGTLVSGHEQNALHWGAKYAGDHYIDPLTLLLGAVRLKPWD